MIYNARENDDDGNPRIGDESLPGPTASIKATSKMRRIWMNYINSQNGEGP
ncbi:hypothetical protein [Arachidicoccus sp.]|uniref:hypothetical protein n=1 Tax=Arachidicoccus sp. TaxID=1872624 RepID=UPI003D1E9185